MQDQKEITLKWWDWLEGKEDYGKKNKRYCQTTAVSSDKKFLASLDKIMKKEKKNMDAAYAGDPTASFDNMYERLNDMDFLFSIGKMILED